MKMQFVHGSKKMKRPKLLPRKGNEHLPSADNSANWVKMTHSAIGRAETIAGTSSGAGDAGRQKSQVTTGVANMIKGGAHTNKQAIAAEIDQASGLSANIAPELR
jgi:hypothetical protein